MINTINMVVFPIIKEMITIIMDESEFSIIMVKIGNFPMWLVFLHVSIRSLTTVML